MNHLKKQNGTFRKHMDVINMFMKILEEYKDNEKFTISNMELKVISSITRTKVDRENYISVIMEYLSSELPRKINMLDNEDKNKIDKGIENFYS